MTQAQMTPLAKALAGEASTGAASPLTALEVGRQRWLDCERINMGSIADEVGVNRATLFRWVGSRELFVGEIIWSFYQDLIDKTLEATSGEGPDYVVAVLEQLLRKVVNTKQLHHFIRQDPEYAIRILTSRSSLFQARSVNMVRGLIAEQTGKTDWTPPIHQDDLAFLIIRVGESFLYGDVISGQKTDIAQTTTAFRLLLSGQA
ncbi:QsdR family transcriptional regulator [Marinobacter sp. OP 3.4]|uniref:QsdR family transcriptional regulator n=1 Tax=Marinobacter sp. OP 3.4 TaxID=3076501 RepID=UPI002E22C363